MNSADKERVTRDFIKDYTLKWKLDTEDGIIINSQPMEDMSTREVILVTVLAIPVGIGIGVGYAIVAPLVGMFTSLQGLWILSKNRNWTTGWKRFAVKSRGKNE
jgi:hypothetical protein